MKLQIDISNMLVFSPDSGFPITIPKVGPILLDVDVNSLKVMDAGNQLAQHEIFLPNGKKIVISFSSSDLMKMSESMAKIEQCIIQGDQCGGNTFSYVFSLDSNVDKSLQIIDTRTPGDAMALFGWGVRCDISAGGSV